MRAPVTIRAKLLTALLVIVTLQVAVGIVGLQALREANLHTEEVVAQDEVDLYGLVKTDHDQFRASSIFPACASSMT